MPFQYRKIVVVGATSGIGEALADRFVKEGSFVVAVGRRKEKLADLVHRHGHDKAQAVTLDITKTETIPNFVTNITNTHPDVDCIVLNSGMQQPSNFSDPASIDMNAITLEMATNYLSYLALTKAFLPFLQAKKSESALIYVSSGLALLPSPNVANYSASKAALHHFVLALRAQLREWPIKVIELYPPAVQTELHDYMEGGRSMGMPLDQFTNEAYDGLASGAEQVPVGMAKASFDNGGWEVQRQERFEKFFVK